MTFRGHTASEWRARTWRQPCRCCTARASPTPGCATSQGAAVCLPVETFRDRQQRPLSSAWTSTWAEK